MLIVYVISRKNIKRRIRNDRTTERESARAILKKIAVIAIPITIGAAIMPIVNLIDAGIVQTRLLSSGWDEVAAESLYGQLTGFASPITQFPQVFMTAIVMSLVPMVSAANRVGNKKELHSHISLGLRMTTIIAFPCGYRNVCSFRTYSYIALFITKGKCCGSSAMFANIFDRLRIFGYNNNYDRCSSGNRKTTFTCYKPFYWSSRKIYRYVDADCSSVCKCQRCGNRLCSSLFDSYDIGSHSCEEVQRSEILFESDCFKTFDIRRCYGCDSCIGI